jgi:hypothetical protein
MAKTKAEREAEEQQQQEELSAFTGRSLRRSTPGKQPIAGPSGSSGLPTLQEEEDLYSEDAGVASSAPRRDQNLNIPAPSYSPAITSIFKMGESGGRNQLPDGMKLKGEENYVAWKEAIENLAISNDLRRFIHEKGRAPRYVDEFDDDVDEAQLALWKAWAAGDSSMKLIIQLNVKKTPVLMLAGCKTARKMWATLQTQYEGTGAVLNFNAIETYENQV